MRFKLLRRRLTISAPRMKVRSAMPWPLRWASAAIVLGFCGAISLWAFELGKDLAGVDHGDREELSRLREDVVKLREDLGFFEKLMPASGTEAVAIRGLQAEVLSGTQLKWQVLVIQAVKNAPEFRGKLEVSFSGTLEGKPWTMQLPGGPQPLQFRQYRRVEGMVDLPPQAVVKNVSARVVEGSVSRAVQNVSL